MKTFLALVFLLCSVIVSYTVAQQGTPTKPATASNKSITKPLHAPASPKAPGKSKARLGSHMEGQICYGPPVTTQDRNNVVLDASAQDAYHRNFANAAFTRYELSVSTPITWHFTGKPYVNLVSGDKSGFDWNNFPGASDRFIITQSTPNYISATVWAGSHSMQINLACEATKD